MANRFTDTNIWKNQKWFRELSPNHKLAFFYIKDHCDLSGLWKIDCGDLMEYTKIAEFDLQKFVEAVNTDHDKLTGARIEKTRLRVINQQIIWIVKFIDYQYKGKSTSINPYSPIIYSALSILDAHNLLELGVREGYISLSIPYTKGMLSIKEKEKVKEIKELKEGTGTIKRKSGDRNRVSIDYPKKTNGKLEKLEELKQQLHQK